MRNIENKKALYEKIMRTVSKEVKKALNESIDYQGLEDLALQLISEYNITNSWTYDDVIDTVFSIDLADYGYRYSEDDSSEALNHIVKCIMNAINPIRESVKFNKRKKLNEDIPSRWYNGRYGVPANYPIRAFSPSGVDMQYGDIEKMAKYYKKDSNPERLVKSISDGRKLVARWAVAILMNWTKAADVFEAEVRSRRMLTTSNIERVKNELYPLINDFKKEFGHKWT